MFAFNSVYQNMDGGLENKLEVIFIPPRRRIKATASQAPRAQKVMNFKSPWIFFFLFKDISFGDFFISWFLLSASRFSKYYTKGFFFKSHFFKSRFFLPQYFLWPSLFLKKKRREEFQRSYHILPHYIMKLFQM